MQRLPWNTEHHEEWKEPPHSRTFHRKPSATPDWWQVQSHDHKQEGFHIPSVSQDPFHSHPPDVSYTAVKPGAQILLLPAFHFLSLQPYRNSWVTSDKKHTQCNNENRCVKKRKTTHEMPAVLGSSAVLGGVLIQSMNRRVRGFTAPKPKRASSSKELSSNDWGIVVLFGLFVGFFLLFCPLFCLRSASWFSVQEFQTSSPKMQFTGEVHAKMCTQNFSGNHEVLFTSLTSLWALSPSPFCSAPINFPGPLGTSQVLCRTHFAHTHFF